MDKITIIYNPASGHYDSQRIAEKAQQELIAHYDSHYEISLCATESSDDAQKFAEKAAREKQEMIVVLGGDGTINEVAQGIIQSGQGEAIKLAILPCGTVNNLSKVLHIPQLIPVAIKNLTQGTPKKVDLGLVNDQVIISTLTIGILADIAVNVSQAEKRRFGPLAFLWKGLKVLLRHKDTEITLKYQNKTEQIHAQMLLVTMTNSVGGFTNFDPEAKADDGKLHVFVVPRLAWWKFIYFIPFFFTGNFKHFPGIQYFKTNDLSIKGDTKIRSRVDGDPSAYLPLHLRVEPQFLQVITPKEV